ncbi:MAG: hypothetical protein UZ17_ACD001002959, partial [Acidobacteria bacterium OLB17]
MSLIDEAFVNALLADAAYAADLVDGLSGPALRSVLERRMTASLAQYISQTFSVLTTIDTPDDIAGPGFDATVWRRNADGKLFVSIRGTEGTADILTCAAPPKCAIGDARCRPERDTDPRIAHPHHPARHPPARARLRRAAGEGRGKFIG